MADDTDGSPFRFIAVREDIKLDCVSYDRKKKFQLLVSAGVYDANSSVERLAGEEKWKEIVYAKNYQRYLTLHAVEERLKSPQRRQDDYNDLQKAVDAKPFELWDKEGDLESIPRSLILTNKPYDDKVDEAQLRRWIDVANKLGGKPPENINPKYARFALRPSDALKTKAKNELLYCSPAESPAFGVTTDKLEAIIAANTGKFNGWPDPVVVDYATARDTLGLKLVGRNFLQFYFVWMKVEYYAELWQEFGVSELLHALPSEGVENTYKDVDENILKGNRGGPAIDGAVTEIVSTSLGARDRKSEGLTTDKVMGKNAKTVADKLWGDKFITSGMGKNSKGEISTVEWLHRVAFAFGGQDVFKNLVFGSWECNTDMIRAENFVTELTKKDKKRTDYKGSLTTVNNTAATLSRFRLAKENTVATVPSWGKKYSWLCFSLNYRYVMDADKCPLNGGVAHDVDFDPWSIYVPLSIEPRLDVMILNYLKSGGNTANVMAHSIKKRSLVSNIVENLQTLRNLPLPEYRSDAYPTLAWNAAINGLPSVNLSDIVVKNPTIARSPFPDEDSTSKSIVRHLSRFRHSIPFNIPVPHGGFVLQGEVDVFGTAVVGNLQKWIGPPPEGVVVGIDPPAIERVVIPGDFHMSMLIPLLSGTPFDKIIFRNVAVSHQNYAFDRTKSIGWHFNADWVIDPSCGLLYDILTTVLQVDKPILSIHASLGEGLHWNVPLNLHSFLLEGVFPELTLSPVSGLMLTSIGVRLLGIRGFSFVPEPHSTLSFGFAVFGTMKLDVPGSIVPLDLDYEMGIAGSTVNLHAEISGSIWEDALGVNGLLLEDVAFGTTFSTTSPWKTFAFDVSATFSYMSSQAYLQGSYAAGGHFSLTAELDNFGTNEIDGLFYALFSDSLTLPDFDVHIGSAIISVASGQGLSVSLLDVNVGGYTAASVALSMSSLGVSLSGALSNSTITFGDVELHDALIKLSFWTVGKKKSVDLMLGGTLGVDFLDLSVGAVVHLYPGRGGVEWAIVAELSAPGRSFAISDVVPAVKHSFVDFSLRDAVIIAASKDDPLIGQSFPEYRVRKGVQVFGVIDCIPALDDLLRQQVKGLVFSAGWSKTSGFSLFVSLPAESTIDLGNGIKTTPITLGIRTKPVELAIMAGVRVPVKDSTPLDFSFVLAANAIGASASAQMEGWWVKPFGIDNLKVGPEVTLSIEIVYAQFVSTGTPSGFGVSGGLMIGNIEAFLAMNVSEDPKRQLLFGEVKKLDISDVVEFAGTLVQQDIPKIPDGLLKFEELQVYICPSGVVLGKTVYPQGFSFKADLLVFEKRANIECTIDKAQKSVDIVGGIDNFELGPLTVHGSKGPRAMLECHIGVSKQELVVDGVVSLFDAQAQILVNVQFLPDPKFKFYVLLQFAQIFMFKLDAELMGSIHDRLPDADFSLYAELEDDILEYIAQQIIELFEAVKVAATEGLEVAQAKVDEAQTQWEGMVADAQRKVDDAQMKWESYEQNVRSTSQPVIDNYLVEVFRLEGDVDKARKDYNNALDDAERKVNQANQDRGAALAFAQHKVEKAKRDMDNAIDYAQRKVDYAKADIEMAFGDAQRAIDKAQRDVWSLQNQTNDIKSIVYEYEAAPWYRFDLKVAIPGLWVAVGGLEASKGVASGLLDAAREFLKAPEYVAKVGALETAREGLNLARSGGEALLWETEEGLRLADQGSQALVDAANVGLESVQKGVEFVALQGAIEALEAFKTANEAAYSEAISAIQWLMKSDEYVAFNLARAGLSAAKGSTALLDAAKKGLALAEKESQTTLSILEEVVKFGAKAVNIKTMILSGTLRGILGTGGGHARPLSAVVKGYVVGQWFDIEVEFDPRKLVEFITLLFKQLWDLASNAFKLNLMVAFDEQHHLVKREVIDDGLLLTARSRFLQQQPHVVKILTDKSEPISTDIPRGPFSGKPIVPSLVVARKALVLMQEDMGISVLKDLVGM